MTEQVKEINETLAIIEEIFKDEKVIHCIQQFNTDDSVSKLVYAGTIISFLSRYANNINDILNFLHTAITMAPTEILNKRKKSIN